MVVFAFCTAVPSCYVSKNSDFFKNLTTDTLVDGYSVDHEKILLKPNDLLLIKVSSMNPETDASFNNAIHEKFGNSGGEKNEGGFLVNENGEINVRFLGNIKVEGLTKLELKNKLENELKPFMKEPIVNIAFLNKKVTVIGQVVNPKIISINDNNTTLFDVIANCGNLKEDANTNDLVIIRDSGSKKMVKHINLEDRTFLNSPWYYVKFDDVIYVKRDNKKLDKEIRKRELQTAVSLTASVFSLAVLVLNLIKK